MLLTNSFCFTSRKLSSLAFACWNTISLHVQAGEYYFHYSYIEHWKRRLARILQKAVCNKTSEIHIQLYLLLQTLGIIYSSCTRVHSSCDTEHFERTKGNGAVLNFPSFETLYFFNFDDKEEASTKILFIKFGKTSESIGKYTKSYT